MCQFQECSRTIGEFGHASRHEVVLHGLGVEAEILGHPAQSHDLLPATGKETVPRVFKRVEEVAVVEEETQPFESLGHFHFGPHA